MRIQDRTILRLDTIRFGLGIMAGFLTGLFSVFLGSLSLLLGRVLVSSFIQSGLDLSLLQGGLKSVTIEMPLVVFGLPLLDTGICPGILTGAFAHRWRSYRSLLLVGLLSGTLYDGIVWLTYRIFDPVLYLSFIGLELFIAVVVGKVDRLFLSWWSPSIHEDSLPSRIPSGWYRWIGTGCGGGLILLIGLQSCCTDSFPEKGFATKIEEFMRLHEPGTAIDLLQSSDLSGWNVQGLGQWTIHDGVLTVRRGSGYLASQWDQFTDLIVEVDIRVNPRGNSGIFFRAHHPPPGLRSQPVGYEAQVDHDDPHNPTGSLYKRRKANRILSQDSEWFHMKLITIGERIQIQVNGETVVDAIDRDHREGFLALQAHDPYSVVSYKNLWIRIPGDGDFQSENQGKS